MIGSTLLAIPGSVLFTCSAVAKAVTGEKDATEDLANAAICAHVVIDGFNRGTIEPARDKMAKVIVNSTCDAIDAAGSVVRFAEKTIRNAKETRFNPNLS